MKAALLKILAAAVACASLAAPLAARAEGGGSMIKVDLAGGSQTQQLSLPSGRSAVVDLPVDARDVLVSNPGVAQAVLRTPRRIFVMGLKSGVTDAMFFDASGRRILALNIHVEQNTSALAQTIDRVVPGAQVHVDALNNSIILSGTVMSLADADKAVQIARATVEKPEMVLNMIGIAGQEQVMLKVRILEVDRQVIKQLGVNWNAVIGQAGSPQFLIGTAATYGVNGALLGGLSSFGPNLNTTTQPEVLAFDPLTKTRDLPQVCRTCTNGGQGTISTLQNTAGSTGLNQGSGNIQAYEQVGLVRTLAEPNLTAISGESAKFLVGGEFPVPVSESTTGSVSVNFKPFGVGLGFTPVVLSGGRISLKLSTEVSELSNQGAFNVSTGAGGPVLVVPALTVRRAETTVELPSGGAMMIAGLLQDKSAQDIAGIPGAKDLPVLGALFRSRDYQSGQTELVIMVTPYLVKPTNPNELQTPMDGLQIASELDTILLGRLNRTYKHDPKATEGRTYQGPYGYVVE
ncbi:MAG TPA: type II and III secretion system protein family protein [Caulobacteraceae bacterium]|jgi:pilus assembly protein CpaC